MTKLSRRLALGAISQAIRRNGMLLYSSTEFILKPITREISELFLLYKRKDLGSNKIFKLRIIILFSKFLEWNFHAYYISLIQV